MNLFKKTKPTAPRTSDLSIIVARLNGDSDGSATKLLCKLLEKQPELKVQLTDSCLFYYGQNRSELNAQIHSALQGTKAEALLWGSIVESEAKTVFHLYWTPQEILFTNHPSGRFQPGTEIVLPPLEQNDLATVVPLLIEIRKVESQRAKSTVKLFQAIDEFRILSMKPDATWNGDGLGRLGFLLGYSLLTAGWTSKNPLFLNEAALMFQELSQQYTRESDAATWSVIQNKLGFSLLALGICTSGKEYLEASLEAFQNALWESDREKKPLHWAAALHSYGYALTVLADTEEPQPSISYLEEAVDAFQECLGVYSQVSSPREWAMVQTNLGSAQLRLGEKKFSNEFLHASVMSFRDALIQLQSRRETKELVMVQLSVGIALLELGEIEGREEYFHEAQEAFHEASLVCAEEKEPIVWDKIPDTVRAMCAQYIAQPDTDKVEDYLSALQKRLQMYIQPSTFLTE